MPSTTPAPTECAYLEEGTGPAVVLVHASCTDHRIWVPHARRIGQRHHVIAPTQRYFGTSAWSDQGQDFSLSTHADDLAQLLKGLRLGPVCLVGWSYGAAVCLLTAVHEPELIQRLVLYEPAIASFVDAPADAQAAATDRVEMIEPARVRIREGDVRAALPLFMDGVNDQIGAFDGLPERVRQIMLDNSRTLPLLFAAPLPALSSEHLKQLEPTTLFIARGDSTRTFYRIAADSVATCVPSATLVVVPNARHLLPVQDHARFTELILNLLAAATPDRST